MHQRVPSILILSESVEKVKVSQAGDAISDAFTMAAADMRTAFVEITNAVHAIDQVLRMQDEELQMPSWGGLLASEVLI